MYELISTTQEKTERGAKYWNVVVWDGEGYLECTYFGNTKPKKVLAVKVSSRKGMNYFNAIIQPHTSRDKDTGRFKKEWRTK